MSAARECGGGRGHGQPLARDRARARDRGRDDLVAAAAGYVVAGWAGLSVAVTAGTAVAMVVLRYLLPTLTPDEARKAREKPQARPLSGYSAPALRVADLDRQQGLLPG